MRSLRGRFLAQLFMALQLKIFFF